MFNRGVGTPPFSTSFGTLPGRPAPGGPAPPRHAPASGEACVLNRETARHWQYGGPEGAIITEYGTFHDNDAVRHSDPSIVFP